MSHTMNKIVTAEIFCIGYKLPGYKLSFGNVTDVQAVVVKLTDASGAFGWGEGNPLQPFTEESPIECAEVLKNTLLPIVLNEANPDPVAIDKLLDTQLPDKHLIAKGAITMALLDLQGKKLGVHVSQLLGPVLSQSLPVLWPLSNGSAADDIKVIDEKIALGFTTFMLKMGTSSIDDEIKRVADLEAHYGETVKFIADANAGWTYDESVQFLEGVKNSRLVFVEQPVAKYDLDSMALLTKNTNLLISADESLTGIGEAKEIVSRGAANVFSMKSTKNGGPLRAKALAALGSQNGIQFYFNSMLEGGITQIASLSHAVTQEHLVDAGHAYMSVLRLDGDVTNFHEYIRDGMVYLPTGAGWGITVDEAAVRRSAAFYKKVEKFEVV